MLIGYAITFCVYASFALMLAFLFLERKGIADLFRKRLSRYSVLAILLILAFFLVFELVYMHPAEQLYFDENIYQSIALNMMHSGQALWCQFGTGLLNTCYINSLYHDPVGWSAFIAIAFTLFGVGTETAFALELLTGVVSVLLMFFLASLLSERKEFPVLASLSLAMMPLLAIWARTQADADLPFMMLVIVSFLLFVIFTKRRSFNSLAAFSFSVVLISYMRTEAILLVPVFLVLLFTFSDEGIARTLRKNARAAIEALKNSSKVLILLLVALLLIVTQVYYIGTQLQSPDYGQSANQTVISFSNFQSNIGINLLFLVGYYDRLSYYPAVFSYTIAPLAILGVIALLLRNRARNRYGVLLLTGTWFLTYFLFYTSFFAGYATYGVDSRFMLQLMPPLVLLASFALLGIGDAAVAAAKHVQRRIKAAGGRLVFYMALVAAVTALIALPFALVLSIVTLPITSMPQQVVIAPAMANFYSNYTDVPNNCLVFSNTPDTWLEENVSSIQLQYIGSTNQSMNNTINSYSCKVLDYGYWCLVPPFFCNAYMGQYAMRPLIHYKVNVSNTSIQFYRLLNYT